MIDLHTHLLPQLDDGARSPEVAVEMARQAVADGIEAVVATPHSGPSEERIAPQRIHAALADLRQRLSEAGVPLRIYSGEEVSIAAGLVEELQAGTILPIGEGKWVLVELPFNQVPFFAEKELFSLQTSGYRPVVAHPERNIEIQKDWRIAARFAERGAALQLDARSLLGVYGNEARKCAENLLKAAAVHALGSDGHSPEHRRIALSASRDIAARFVGDEGAMLLVKDNPEAIVNGKQVRIVQPVEIPQKRGLFRRLFSS